MIERTEKELRQNLPANESYDPGADDDQWKWHAENINRELLRFRPGQQHAKIQRVEKMRFADPLLFLHDLSVHHRDLAGRSAKGNKAKLEPKAEGFAKRWVTCLVSTFRDCKLCRGLIHRFC